MKVRQHQTHRVLSSTGILTLPAHPKLISQPLTVCGIVHRAAARSASARGGEGGRDEMVYCRRAREQTSVQSSFSVWVAWGGSLSGSGICCPSVSIYPPGVLHCTLYVSVLGGS